MKYNIPVRLAQLQKKQIDLLHEIKKEGIPAPYDNLYPTELSKFIRGDENPPKQFWICATKSLRSGKARNRNALCKNG